MWGSHSMWLVVRAGSLGCSGDMSGTPRCHQIKADAGYFQYGDMQGILKHQGTEALVQAGKSFLRYDGRIAVKDSVIACDDGKYFETGVCVVDDCTCPLNTQRTMFICVSYKGRPINRLQNGVILLTLNIWQIRDIRFVGNLFLSTSCEFCYDDTSIYTSMLLVVVR